MFEELLERAKERAAKEERRAKRAAEDFTALLRSAKDLDPDAPWEDAKAALAKEPEYKAARPQPACAARFHAARPPHGSPEELPSLCAPFVAAHTLHGSAFRVCA